MEMVALLLAGVPLGCQKNARVCQLLGVDGDLLPSSDSNNAAEGGGLSGALGWVVSHCAKRPGAR